MARQELDLQDLEVPVPTEPRRGGRRARQGVQRLVRVHGPHVHTETLRTSAYRNKVTNLSPFNTFL